VNKNFSWDIVNVNSGAIAIGRPIGASGACIPNTLLFEMKRRGASKGLATLCIGAGMGVAMCVEEMGMTLPCLPPLPLFGTTEAGP
jgi:acetyl-CoA C-acetyltransferase